MQAGIPDGYELVPVDRITDEYEIVPWKQVKTLLNISISQIDPAAHAGMCHSMLEVANKDLWIFLVYSLNRQYYQLLFWVIIASCFIITIKVIQLPLNTLMCKYL